MPHKKFRLLCRMSALCLMLLLTIYIFVLKLTNLDLRPQTLIGNIFPPTGNQDVGASRTEIALQLRLITDQLSNALSQQKPPPLGTIQSLRRLVEYLDPSFAASGSTSTAAVKEVCSEYYVNSTFGYPFYFEGWTRTKCDVPSLDTLISIVLNPDETCSRLNWILSGVRKDYPMVSVLVSGKHGCVSDFEKHPQVRIIPVPSHTSEGETWNLLIAAVNTKYVLVGRGISHFNWFARLERQIEVLGMDPLIDVVGGALRNESGHWKVGCFQATMHNYALEYQEGYHSSKNECMFCDYLQSPFVAKTDVLKIVRFDALLSRNVLFEDFFLRLQHQQNHFVLSCPDVMYFQTNSNFIYTKEQWMDVAKRWSLNRIIPSRDVVYSYTCEESGISCTYLYTTTKAFLMPICCIEQEYKQALTLLQQLVDDNDLRIELDCGSVLGAIKFQGMIPWDIDGDMSYNSQNHTFLKEHSKLFAEHGLKLVAVEDGEVDSETGKHSGGYFTLHTPNGVIELFGMNKLSMDVASGLPTEIAKQPTVVNMNGVWINGPVNPGLYARNRYGSNYLKHAQSWRHTGERSSWIAYEIKGFQPCPKHNHHACLDRFYTDGNLQFKVP